jgi:hypothetical protein
VHVHLWGSDLVGDLREHIRRHLYNQDHGAAAAAASPSSKHSSSPGSKGLGHGVHVQAHPSLAPCDLFELRSAYPPRLLTDSMTLEEAGLLPNGTVHARRLQ